MHGDAYAALSAVTAIPHRRRLVHAAMLSCYLFENAVDSAEVAWCSDTSVDQQGVDRMAMLQSTLSCEKAMLLEQGTAQWRKGSCWWGLLTTSLAPHAASSSYAARKPVVRVFSRAMSTLHRHRFEPMAPVSGAPTVAAVLDRASLSGGQQVQCTAVEGSCGVAVTEARHVVH